MIPALSNPSDSISGPPAALPRRDPWRTGLPDRFHRYLDARMRAAGAAGNGSQFVFLLRGTVDGEDLCARLAGLLALAPVLGAGLPPWPATRWVPLPGHSVPLIEERRDGPIGPWFSRWFGEPFVSCAAPSLQVVLGHGDDGTAVLLRWQHALTDAPGMDLLCRLLDGEDPQRFRLRDKEGALGRRLRGEAGWVRRAAEVHALTLRHLARSVPPPYQAPVDPRARQAAPSVALSAEETSALLARGAALGAGLDRNGFLLGLTARACVRAFAPASWRSLRLPVPISLRPPAWRGPVLSNWFAIVLLHLPVRRLRSTEEAVATVRAAWRTALARGEDRATTAMMAPAAWFPPVVARLLLDGPTLRDGATLNTSFVQLKTGERGTFLGLPVDDVILGSSILGRPGLAAVFAGWGQRLTVVVPGQVGPSQDAMLRELSALARGEAD